MLRFNFDGADGEIQNMPDYGVLMFLRRDLRLRLANPFLITGYGSMRLWGKLGASIH